MTKNTGVRWVGILAAGMGFAACLGCAGQTGAVARGRECPAALRGAHVEAEQRPEDIVVRVTSPEGGDPQAIMDNAEMIVEALARHPQTVVGAGEEVRPAPGREVRISRLPNGVEFTFLSSGTVGMEVLRRRIDNRVQSWQAGDCPSLDHTLEGTQANQSSSTNNTAVSVTEQ